MSILLIIGIILLIVWLLGFFAFKVLGSLIHIALAIGVVLVIIWLVRAVFKLF
jgi:hypothetical protein